MSNAKISFTKDIIQEVSKELGIKEGKVWSVYKSMMIYLDYLANKTLAVSIFIPHLGTLHVKIGHVFKKLQQLNSKKVKNEKMIDVYEEKKRLLDNHIQGLVDKEYKRKSRHCQKSRIAMFGFTDGKSIEEIEDIQNSK